MPIVVRERATVKTGSPSSMRVQVITPGAGSTGFYSDAVLRQAVTDKVFPRGLHVFLDHPSESEVYDRPERSVRDLAGVFTADALWDGVGIAANVRIFPQFRESVGAMWQDVGMSIRAYAEIASNAVDGLPVVSRLVSAESVDIVTKAGRGGRIMSVAESKKGGGGGAAGDAWGMSQEDVAAAVEAAFAPLGRKLARSHVSEEQANEAVAAAFGRPNPGDAAMLEDLRRIGLNEAGLACVQGGLADGFYPEEVATFLSLGSPVMTRQRSVDSTVKRAVVETIRRHRPSSARRSAEAAPRVTRPSTAARRPSAPHTRNPPVTEADAAAAVAAAFGRTISKEA